MEANVFVAVVVWMIESGATVVGAGRPLRPMIYWPKRRPIFRIALTHSHSYLRRCR